MVCIDAGIEDTPEPVYTHCLVLSKLITHFDDRSTYRGEIFKSRVWVKVSDGSAFIFEGGRITLQHTVGSVETRKKLSCQNQRDSFSRFDRT